MKGNLVVSVRMINAHALLTLIPLLGIYSADTLAYTQTVLCAIAALFVTANILNHLKITRRIRNFIFDETTKPFLPWILIYIKEGSFLRWSSKPSKKGDCLYIAGRAGGTQNIQTLVNTRGAKPTRPCLEQDFVQASNWHFLGPHSRSQRSRGSGWGKKVADPPDWHSDPE